MQALGEDAPGRWLETVLAGGSALAIHQRRDPWRSLSALSNHAGMEVCGESMDRPVELEA